MKEYSNRIGLQEVWNHFTGFPLAHLATVEGDQPRVRMMALVCHNEKLWFATKTEWDKAEQIRENPKVEVTIPARDQSRAGCLRITATARIVSEGDTRRDLADIIPWFSQYWNSPQDENFTLIELDLRRILFDHPSDGLKYTVAL